MRVVLLPHPLTPCRAVRGIVVTVLRHDDLTLRLRYDVEGDISKLRVPQLSGQPGRADELWRHTCFEAFVRDAGEAYREFNLSPSRMWAAYEFDGYRTGGRVAAGAAPEIASVEMDDADLMLLAHVRPGVPVRGARVALSTVIEDASGTMSYWALAHPAKKPDFHHPDSFTVVVP